MNITNRQEKTGANTGFASGGVTYKIGALCIYSSVVPADSFVLRNPPERKARKRWQQYFQRHHKNYTQLLRSWQGLKRQK